MKRFTKSSVALAVLLSLPVASVFAATPLTAKESSHLVPMKEIAVTGAYMQAGDAEKAISEAADEAGAKFYHIKGLQESVKGDSINHNTVYADIYQENAPVATNKEEVTYNGIVSYERCKALYYVPSEIVKLKGNFNNTSEVTDAASKLAADKNAYAFYVVSISPADAKVQSQNIEVALYNKDAAVREYIKKDLTNDQDAYEISSDAFKTMKSYATITFHGQFNNTSEISQAAAKQAIANGANYYFVKEITANPAGTIQTVYVNLYK